MKPIFLPQHRNRFLSELFSFQNAPSHKWEAALDVHYLCDHQKKQDINVGKEPVLGTAQAHNTHTNTRTHIN